MRVPRALLDMSLGAQPRRELLLAELSAACCSAALARLGWLRSASPLSRVVLWFEKRWLGCRLAKKCCFQSTAFVDVEDLLLFSVVRRQPWFVEGSCVFWGTNGSAVFVTGQRS